MDRIFFSSLLVILCNSLFAQNKKISVYQEIFRSKIDVIHDTLQEEVVFTPFGPTLRPNVHYVDEDHHIEVKDRSIQLIQTKTRVIEHRFDNKYSESDVKYFLKPENKSLFSALSSQDGWITHAECQIYIPDPKPTYFSTDWIVPNYPQKSSNQTIFLFNGLVGCKNLDDNNLIIYILQPVLQWGESAAGGGKYWAICNWLVTNKDQVFYDSLIKVNPGDKLQGVIKLINTSDTLYNYNSSFTGYSGGLDVFCLPRLQTPYVALEAYNIKGCDEYPADEKIRMYNIQIITDSVFPPVIWQTFNTIDNCGQFTNMIDESPNNGEINIHFHKPYSADGFEDIYVYPNPIQNNFHISFTSPIYNCKIEIYNSLGKLIQTEIYKTLEYEHNLNFQNYLSGLYLIKFYYQTSLITREKTYTFKIVKNKL